MRLATVADNAALAASMAEDMAAVLRTAQRAGKGATLIAPVGPVDQFPLLAELIKTERLSLADAVFINMDEYLTDDDAWASLDHPLSFRAFIQESATWCGPCRTLSRFLAAHHEVLERDFIFVKLDHRWPHAREIAERFRGAEYGGIPWCAILDAQAKVLATSDGPDGNIGFPSKSEPRAIEHFISMLRDSRIRLTDDELGQIRANLEQ